MFKKILIAEDHQSTSISVRKTLEDMGITDPEYVYHCDAALLQVKNALLTEPFELLITDLLFEPDDQLQKITDGEALISAARQIQPHLKVLVFSAEQRAAIIDALFKELGVNGYVIKARRDSEELERAIHALYKNKLHYPSNIRQAVQQKNLYKFAKIDITIVRLIYEGKTQKEIPDILEKDQLTPSSLRSIEQRLHLMRTAYNLSNNIQLIALCKEMGII